MVLLLHRVEWVSGRVWGELLEALHLPGEGRRQHTTAWLLKLLAWDALSLLGEERLVGECRSGEGLLKGVHTVQSCPKRRPSIELLCLRGKWVRGLGLGRREKPRGPSE